MQTPVCHMLLSITFDFVPKDESKIEHGLVEHYLKDSEIWVIMLCTAWFYREMLVVPAEASGCM